MHGFAHCLISPSFLGLNSFTFPSTNSSYSPLVCRIWDGHNLESSVCTPSYRSDCYYRKKKTKKKMMMGIFRVRASGRESPYQVLGLSPSASTKDIKRAYRRLALKYHPDVNKEAGSKEKFMRIKHAYNTLLASKSRGKYDAGNQGSDFSYSATRGYQTKNREAEEDFYGFEDFFRDLQEEFRNWDATATAQGKPKSLWEELGEIGEEFVEFLEKELNITDGEVVGNNSESSSEKRYETKERASADQKEASDKRNSIDDNIDEIEAALAQLKKELGL